MLMLFKIEITENQTIVLIIISWLVSIFLYLLPEIFGMNKNLLLVAIVMAMALVSVFIGHKSNAGKIRSFFLCASMTGLLFGMSAWFFIQDLHLSYYGHIIALVLCGITLTMFELFFIQAIFGEPSNIPL